MSLQVAGVPGEPVRCRRVAPVREPPLESLRWAGVASTATLSKMSEIISQRELRNDSGRIMRALDEGRSFILTRHAKPVGELRPLRRERLVDSHAVVEVFRGAPVIDSAGFFADVDAVVDQAPGA